MIETNTPNQNELRLRQFRMRWKALKELLNCLMSSAPGTLGMRVRTPKFRRAMSTLPRAKSFAMAKMYGLTRDQNLLKKQTGNPSGTGAVSTFMLAKTSSRFFYEKVSMSSSFSSSETRPSVAHMTGERARERGSPCSPSSSL